MSIDALLISAPCLNVRANWIWKELESSRELATEINKSGLGTADADADASATATEPELDIRFWIRNLACGRGGKTLISS